MNHCQGIHLKTVGLLLPVPNGAGQGELLADPVLLHRSERSAPEPLRLPVVSVQPQVLKFGVRLASKPVALEDLVKSLKVPTVEGDQGSRSHHGLVSVQGFPRGAGDGGRQRPEEPSEALDVPGLLQVLAHPSDLVRREHRQREHLALSSSVSLNEEVIKCSQDALKSVSTVRKSQSQSCALPFFVMTAG